MMQVHRRWLKLALVTITLMLELADAQVYTMQSDLEDSTSPAPAAKTPIGRIPVTNAPSQADEIPSKTRAPRTEPKRMTKAPKATRAPPAYSDSEVASKNQETVEKKPEPETVKSSSNLKTSGSEKKTESLDEPEPTTKQKKEKNTISTKSPYLKQTISMPNGIHATDDLNFDDSASPSSMTEPKTKKKLLDSTSESDSTSSSTPSSKSFKSTTQDSTAKSSESTKQGSTSESTKQDNSSGLQDSDAIKDEPPTPSPASESSAASGSPSSEPSVLTESASANKTGMSNTLILGLMMGGAVALVMLIVVFIYVKTKDNDDEDIDPVLRTARHDGNKEAAQSSTVAANFHENNNMSPTEYSDDNYYPNNQHHQYDQDAYGHPVKYSDPNYDVLTPQSQIALVHSQMSLPPMAQSDASSQFSHFTTQSDFYGNSANFSSVSQVAHKYPGMRQGTGENDIAGSEDESDYEGDATQDMSHATNKWNHAGRNRGDSAASGMDRSMMESRFEPGDSRSTSASDYTGKNRFKESEYTEYRMSTGYENSHVDGGQGYDNSFASSKSGYDQSFAASKSGYDSGYAGGKSFASSGFSEY